jgi:4-amino-4-deoxy-L-arabinose transferase-like glycosyltransferase
VSRPLARSLPIAFVTLFAAVLLFWRLGAVYLWQDEAATAVMAERMLKYGKPLAYDGRNIITMDSFVDEDWSTVQQRTGSAEAALRYLVARRDFRPDTTWVGQPWGQFAVAAVSLGLLGHGTAQARLPFAVAALATVLLLYWLVHRTFEDRALALLSAVLLVANAFWILHSRQCRYYAFSSLLLLASVGAFLRWQRGGRWGAALFVLAGWVYFQCDFGSFFPAMAVLAILAFVAQWPRVGRPAAVFAALGAATAPFAVYYGLLGRYRRPIQSLANRFEGNLYNVNQYLVALPILALACWLVWRRRAELGPQARALLLASIGMVVSLAIWVPLVAPTAFHRYLVEATPLAAVATAWVLAQAAGWAARASGRAWTRPATLVGLAAVVGATGLVAAPAAAALSSRNRPFRPIERPELEATLREIFEERPDPNRLAIEAIAPSLRPGDEILVNYEDVPFMFYTSARIRGGVAAFRAEDHEAPPPRFLVIRRSVPFVHWSVFRREVARYRWHQLSTGAPDLPFGNFPDPTWVPLPRAPQEVIVAQRVGPAPGDPATPPAP